MSHSYNALIRELAKVTTCAPKGKVPKLYNYHRLVKLPFNPNEQPTATSPTALHQIPLKLKSEQYTNSGRVATATSGAKVMPQDGQEFLQDIPLPDVLMRHIHMPSPSLDKGVSLGKITGFRIEVTGRRGTRSSTQRFAYGKLGTGNVGGAYVDFARSHYVHKKGATGIKVWIGYGR